MKILHTIDDFRAHRRALPPGTLTSFVPTMGALHDGHASLVRTARALGDRPAVRVIASIFVNPTQFGPSEDFTRYPRTLNTDCAILEAAGCDSVFVPSAEEMYPGIGSLNTHQLLHMTSIDPGPLGEALEGAIRPGHFRGVCTVVAKLLNIVQPSTLILGQKDFQQQAVLKNMIRDLNLPVRVVVGETLREPDGLAMSSRNRYLSPDERARANAIYDAMQQAAAAFNGGERNAMPLELLIENHLAARGLAPQYTTIADAATLKPFRDGPVTPPAVILIAAKLGTTRLIDNMVLPSNF